MTDTIRRLEEIYDEYIGTIERLSFEQASFKGLWQRLSGGASVGTDSCNDSFAEKVRACITDFAQSGPDARDAYEVMRYVLERGASESKNESAALMMDAIQAYLTPLAGLLSAEGATALLEAHFDAPSFMLLPVQKQLKKALEKACGRNSR